MVWSMVNEISDMANTHCSMHSQRSGECRGCGGSISGAFFVQDGKMFCSEGCRCAAQLPGSFSDDCDDSWHSQRECMQPPCLHCDSSCPHMPSSATSTGLARNKFGYKRFVCTSHIDGGVYEAALEKGGISSVATLMFPRLEEAEADTQS